MQTIKFVSVASLLLAAAGAAQASSLYGVEYNGFTPLYDVNQGTGALTAIGPTGWDNVADLTSDNSTTIWGNYIIGNALLTFNPATGSATSVTPISGTLAPTGAPTPIVSLGFNPVTGVMYGTTSSSYGDANDTLYSINPASGVATKIGVVGFESVYALACDNTGVLYGISAATDQLITINQGTGAGTLVANLRTSFLYDMAFRPEDNTAFVANSGSSELDTIDVSNGLITQVGSYGFSSNVVGLAFIPTPSAAALLGLGGLAMSRRRR